MKETLSHFFKEFTSSEKNAGMVLIACTLISLLISYTAFSEHYLHFWHTKTGFSLMGTDMHLSVEHWINDGHPTIAGVMLAFAYPFGDGKDHSPSHSLHLPGGVDWHYAIQDEGRIKEDIKKNGVV